MDNFLYYIFILISLIVGIFVIKKITGCVFKVIVALAVAAILIALYYLHGAEGVSVFQPFKKQAKALLYGRIALTL